MLGADSDDGAYFFLSLSAKFTCLLWSEHCLGAGSGKDEGWAAARAVLLSARSTLERSKNAGSRPALFNQDALC